MKIGPKVIVEEKKSRNRRWKKSYQAIVNTPHSDINESYVCQPVARIIIGDPNSAMTTLPAREQKSHSEK